jgi:hypothetical protein
MEKRDDDGRHDTRLSENGRYLNRFTAYGVVGSHRLAVKGRDSAAVGNVLAVETMSTSPAYRCGRPPSGLAYWPPASIASEPGCFRIPRDATL